MEFINRSKKIKTHKIPKLNKRVRKLAEIDELSPNKHLFKSEDKQRISPLKLEFTDYSRTFDITNSLKQENTEIHITNNSNINYKNKEFHALPIQQLDSTNEIEFQKSKSGGKLTGEEKILNAPIVEMMSKILDPRGNNMRGSLTSENSLGNNSTILLREKNSDSGANYSKLKNEIDRERVKYNLKKIKGKWSNAHYMNPPNTWKFKYSLKRTDFINQKLLQGN